jgi:hypothetical protein
MPAIRLPETANEATKEMSRQGKLANAAAFEDEHNTDINASLPNPLIVDHLLIIPNKLAHVKLKIA